MLRIVFFLLFCPVISFGQNLSLDTVQAPLHYDGVFAKMVASDSLSSSFVIFIKKEVKKHKHATHTENVYVLEGEGEMLLGESTFPVKRGDMVFIPMNTPHAVKVTSTIPLKVLSIQSPKFDGKDRIFID